MWVYAMTSSDEEVDVLVMSSILRPGDVEEALKDYMVKKGLKGVIIQKTQAPHEVKEQKQRR